jgi:hypothetical protein
MDKSLLYEYTTLSADECSDLMLDNAKIYLQLSTGGDSWAVEQILTNSLFWDWWAHQWEQRDRAFVDWLEIQEIHKVHVLHASDILSMIKDAYLEQNDPRCLFEKGIKPHKILEQKILKEAVRKEVIKHGN